MIGDWTAAAVRARAVADRRAGAGAADAAGACPGLAEAVGSLSATLYGSRLSVAAVGLADAQRAVRASVLWELRVLAGWMPPSGTRLARALAAVFEVDDLVALADALARGIPAPAARYDLGALSVVAPSVWTADGADVLRSLLRHGAWGDPGGDASAVRDVLTASMWRRIAWTAPGARGWAAGALVLLAARMRLVERRDVPERFAVQSRALIGDAWIGCDDAAGFRRAIPPASAWVLEGVTAAQDLWRSEATWRDRVERDGFRLLRDRGLGPQALLGAFAVLWCDALRVSEALATAQAGAVLDDVA